MDAVLHDTDPLHMECLRFLADWDAAIGTFLDKYDALPEPKRLFALADHGFTEIRTEVSINTWLKRTMDCSPWPDLADNGWDSTVIGTSARVFALDPGRIYVHTRDRFARGPVTAAEMPVLLEYREVQPDALDLERRAGRGTYLRGGRPLSGRDFRPIARTWSCEARPGFDLKAKFDRQNIFGLHGRTGTHTVDGAIFADSRRLRVPERMRDVGRIILLEHFDITE